MSDIYYHGYLDALIACFVILLLAFVFAIGNQRHQNKKYERSAQKRRDKIPAWQKSGKRYQEGEE